MIVLVSAVAFTIVFATMAAVFGGFVKKATDQYPSLKDDSKTAQSLVHVCGWCAVVFSIIALISGFALSRESRRHRMAPAIVAAQDPPDTSSISSAETSTT